MLSHHALSEKYAIIEEIERQRIAAQQLLTELQDKLYETLALMHKNGTRAYGFSDNEPEHPRKKRRKQSTETEEVQQVGPAMSRSCEICLRSRPKARTDKHICSDDTHP
ncbi:hypothetical protein AX14_001733, partial [Amanita brunnescens Koide BX004]